MQDPCAKPLQAIHEFNAIVRRQLSDVTFLSMIEKSSSKTEAEAIRWAIDKLDTVTNKEDLKKAYSIFRTYISELLVDTILIEKESECAEFVATAKKTMAELYRYVMLNCYFTASSIESEKSS